MSTDVAQPVSTVALATARASFSSSLMFWWLFSMGSATLTPCLLLPVWRDYQALCAAEQVAAQDVERLREQAADGRRRLDAIRNDPATVERMAQRELAYVKPSEHYIRVERVRVTEAPAAGYTLEPPRPPHPIASIVGRLPRTDYDGLFCTEPTRSTLMGLSLAVIFAAFALCRPSAAQPG